MGFPEVIFGKCPVCGSDGGDCPAVDLTSADSSSNIEATGNGVQLFEYQGQVMCELCIKDKQADKESLRSAEKIAEEERFRQKAGFTKTVT